MRYVLGDSKVCFERLNIMTKRFKRPKNLNKKYTTKQDLEIVERIATGVAGALAIWAQDNTDNLFSEGEKDKWATEAGYVAAIMYEGLRKDFTFECKKQL